MGWFFLDSKLLFKIAILTVFIFKLLPILISIVWTIFILALLLLFRRARINYIDVLSSNELSLSPVSGNIIEIIENDTYLDQSFTTIKIAVSISSTFGVYLPHFAKISLMNASELYLENKSKRASFLKLKSRFDFFKIKIWVRPGDFGSTMSCIGFLPFGGIVSVGISSDDDILVKIGDKVVATQTPLGTHKG